MPDRGRMSDLTWILAWQEYYELINPANLTEVMRLCSRLEGRSLCNPQYLFAVLIFESFARRRIRLLNDNDDDEALAEATAATIEFNMDRFSAVLQMYWAYFRPDNPVDVLIAHYQPELARLLEKKYTVSTKVYLAAAIALYYEERRNDVR